MPEAEGWFGEADALAKGSGPEGDDDLLAWRARAALRATDAKRWQRVQAAIRAMSPAQQREPVWTYWQGRALLARAPEGAAGEPQRAAGTALLERAAATYEFYGKLASEDLGRPQPLPAVPAPLSIEDRALAEAHPGLNRALALIAIGLRGEGVREWNFALRDFSTDAGLRAAAQRACEREIWDRCINTSERTRQDIDMAQRFPMPFRAEVTAAAQRAGLDPAYVYGLIRQESRFQPDVRSSVGAAGLMQLMPTTAKWIARKLGVPFQPEQVTDKQVNLVLGTGYLKMVLDDFDGSPAMAAAAYNAGPGRPRRWREGPVLEVAAWAENIPFTETRDYVKRVLSNTSYYAALMNGQAAVTLKPRLGPAVGPRPVAEPPPNPELP
jgi:soluble lytic murein transglycosylase